MYRVPEKRGNRKNISKYYQWTLEYLNTTGIAVNVKCLKLKFKNYICKTNILRTTKHVVENLIRTK